MLRMIALPLLHRKEHATQQMVASGFCLSCECHKYFVPQHYQHMLPNIAKVRPNITIAFLISREFQFYDTVVAFGCRTHKCLKQADGCSSFWPHVKTMELVNGQCCSNHGSEVDFILSSVVGTTSLTIESLMINDSTRETHEILTHFGNINRSPQCKHFHLEQLSLSVQLFDAKFSRLVASVIQSQKSLQHLKLSGTFTEFEQYKELMTELLAFLNRPFFHGLSLQNVDSTEINKKQNGILSNFVHVQLLKNFLSIPTDSEQSLKLKNIQFPEIESSNCLGDDNSPATMNTSNKIVVFDSITFDEHAFTLLQLLPTVLLKQLEFSNCDIKLLHECFATNVITVELVLRNLKCSFVENNSMTFGKLLQPLLLNSTIESITIELGDNIHNNDQSVHIQSLAEAVSEHAVKIKSIRKVSFGCNSAGPVEHTKAYIDPLLESFGDLAEENKIDMTAINTDFSLEILEQLRRVWESRNSRQQFNTITYYHVLPLALTEKLERMCNGLKFIRVM